MIEANCKKIAPSTMATPRPVPKLVVCDLDGTLLRAENGIRLYSDHISPRTVAAIEAFERRGGHFVPATGNGWAVTSRWRREAKIACKWSVCADGALVFDADGTPAFGRRVLVRDCEPVVRACTNRLHQHCPAFGAAGGGSGDGKSGGDGCGGSNGAGASIGSHKLGWHVYSDPPGAYFSSEWARVLLFESLSEHCDASAADVQGDFQSHGWHVHVPQHETIAASCSVSDSIATGCDDGSLLTSAPHDHYCSAIYFFSQSNDAGPGEAVTPDLLLTQLGEALCEAGLDDSWEVVASQSFFTDTGACIVRPKAASVCSLEHASGAYQGEHPASSSASDQDAIGLREVGDEGKHIGVYWVARQLGIDRKDIMAVGDGGNDATMLQWAGWGVAPANCSPRARTAADEVLPHTNDEDAVAVLLESIVEAMH